MKLELSGAEVEKEFDDALIKNLLGSLKSDDDSFLILSKDTASYIQTAKAGDGFFVLEYQEGSLENHYECVDKQLNLQKVSMAFSSYFNGTDEWKTALKWEPQDFSTTGTPISLPVKLLVLMIVAVIIASVFVIFSSSGG